MVFSRIAAFFSSRAGSATLRTPEAMEEVKGFVDGLLASKKVVVFSKSYCPYCHKAKAALQSLNLLPGSLEWIEIERREDCDAIQDYMGQLTGGRSVPRVFVGGKFLGGGDDTVAAKKNGTLQKKLADVGAI
uniref:Glutaredoxin-1 n=2 Tax=Steinernema glaseri TaxID=37863 RepID=A0A1I7ZVT3_9BILA